MTINEAKEYMKNLKNYIDNNFSHHSDLNKGILAIDVKSYNFDIPSQDDIIKNLQKRGINKIVLKDFIENYNDDEIREYVLNNAFDIAISEMNNTIDASFYGLDGKSGGHALFYFEEDKSVLSSINDIDYLEDEEVIELVEHDTLYDISETYDSVKKIHNNFDKTQDIDFVTDIIIQIYELKNDIEFEFFNAELDIQKNLGMTTIITPTNDFIIEGISEIRLWGGGDATIEMDKEVFTAENTLDNDIIFENLNDGKFGVEKILSAPELVLSQNIKIEKEYENGKKIDYTTSEEIFEGSMDRDKNLFDYDGKKIEKIEIIDKTEIEERAPGKLSKDTISTLQKLDASPKKRYSPLKAYKLLSNKNPSDLEKEKSLSIDR